MVDPPPGQSGAALWASNLLCNIFRGNPFFTLTCLVYMSLIFEILFMYRYLQVEWDNKKAKTEGPRVFDKDTIKGGNPKCPQQTNYSDCGVYVLQYVESFFLVSLVCHFLFEIFG